MANYKAEYLRYMDEHGVRYQDLSEFAVSVTYTGDNLKSIAIIVEFDQNGGNLVTFHCWSIGKFKDSEKAMKGILVCNEMNKNYRWVKFYLDDEQEIVSSADAILNIESAGAECHEMVGRMVGITDEAYPDFMRALWA